MNYNILFIVPDIGLIILFIKEYINMLKCKKIFTCSNCGYLLGTIQYKEKCPKSHRTIKINSEHWEHFMTFRYTYIDSKNKYYKYQYKAYKKQFIIELIVCGTGIIALTIISILAVINIVG